MSLVGDYYSSSSDDDGEIKITGNRKEKKKIYISLTNKDFDSSDEESGVPLKKNYFSKEVSLTSLLPLPKSGSLKVANTHKRIAITKNVLNKKHKDEVFSQENELTSLESNKAEISEVKEESFTAPYPQADLKVKQSLSPIKNFVLFPRGSGFFRPVAEEPVTLHVPGSTHDDSLRKLFGKNHPQNIQLIDFDDSIRLEENRKWLQLHGHEKPKAPLSVMLSVGSGIQKRKHQITFLASQAKRNAEALEEHWASCRSKQRAGRSTYGFM